MKKLIVCSESLYLPIATFIGDSELAEVKPYNESFLTRLNTGNPGIIHLADLIEQFIRYDVVYIIPVSLREGLELTLFFSEIGSKTIVVATQEAKYFSIYKSMGAKIVICSRPGESSYSWLQHVT